MRLLEEKSSVVYISIMVNQGWCVNEKDRERNTPLHIAISDNRSEIVKIVLTKFQI